MNRIVSRVLSALVFVALTASLAFPYGPSIHMREASTYVTLSYRVGPLPGPEHDPVLLETQKWFLWLGSIWPDIARLLTDKRSGGPGLVDVDEGVVDPHNRHFNRYLLEEALAVYPAEPWRVAFAVGCLIHNTGDMISQDMLTQHMAVRAGTGEMDVIPGSFDTHAGGEVEGLIEGGLEIMEPALWTYVVMADRFLGTPEGQADLLMVLDYYMPEYEAYFGLPPGSAGRAGALGRAEAILGDLPGSLTADPVDAGRAIDWDEMLRILSGPAGTQPFWDLYYTEYYFLLSPVIMLSYESGQAYFDNYPNWDSKMMKSGMIQSLNGFLPGRLAEEDGRFLSELRWVDDDTGLSVTRIDALAPPSTVTLTVKLYEALGHTPREDVVSLRVREDSAAGTVVQSASADVGMELWDVNDVTPRTLSVTFDPAPAIAAGASGFFAELAHGTDPAGLPYFTTDWSVYTAIGEIDFTKDAYTLQYSSYGDWPYSLGVVGAK